MEVLKYYMLVNLYILFFWIFFHFILKNETIFQQLRLYLLASVLISIFLPFLHFRWQFVSFIYKQIPVDLDFTFIATPAFENVVADTIAKQSIPYDLIIKLLILAGSCIFLVINLIRHFKIHYLINKSEGVRYRNLYIKTTNRPIIPLLYNKYIIIPKTVPEEEMDFIVEHEYQHHHLGHHIDILFLQIVQIIFWFNPVIYLLIRDIKQIHEYQVDRKIITAGIDASIYKLTLIKYSVGLQKFAIANGLSNCKIKNRIIMISNMNNKKWKWKFLFFIPAFFMVFLILSFTISVNDTLKKSSDALLNNFEQQSINSTEIELTNISYE
ncbi:MAG TPA: M56 family metallopeptidase [Bacteroidales bacterium]|nr:M56 family metallopeptidase [Bacteroidales bacterium]